MKNWVNGVEGESFAGLSARFGASLPNDAVAAHRTPAVMANPFDSCTNSSSKVILFTISGWPYFVLIDLGTILG